MMLQDVCELSSMLRSHDMKKNYLEKKLLSLNSAIEQQNHRVSVQLVIMFSKYIILKYNEFFASYHDSCSMRLMNISVC